jgi:hypothetical protein
MSFAEISSTRIIQSKAKKIAENRMDYQRTKAFKKAEVEEVNIQLEKGEITLKRFNIKAAACSKL